MLRAFFSLGSTLLALLPMAATADPLCADRGLVINHLTDTFSERRVSRGVTDTGSVIEVFASETGGWTMVLTSPAGTSCLVMSGEAWETMVTVVEAPTS